MPDTLYFKAGLYHYPGGQTSLCGLGLREMTPIEIRHGKATCPGCLAVVRSKELEAELAATSAKLAAIQAEIVTLRQKHEF